MKSFNEVFEDKTKYGTKVKTDEYHESGAHIIIDQGQSQIAGYTDLEEGLFQDVPAIIFGDHTRVVKYIEEPFFLGADGVKVLKSKLPDANYKYLYYALRNAKIPNTGYNRHFKWVKELQFKYPGADEQASIVETLDKVEKIISTRQEELQTLDELIKARFVELFGDLKINNRQWDVLTFSDIASIDTNMIHDFSDYQDYPHIGIDSIEKETGRLVGYRTVSEDGVISGKYLFTPEHIIYSKIRPNLNKVAMPDFMGVCSADAYPILVNKNKCNREFLTYVLRSNVFLDYILAFSNRTNLPKVNKQQVEGFKCPVPPIELQEVFKTFVEQVDKSKVAVQKTLDETQVLFDSLMQEYFG